MALEEAGGIMFITHTDQNGTRNVGVVIVETEARYQVWFGGTINRKPRVFWVDKSECKRISPKRIFVD
jgi:hypothetical protein